MGKFFDGAAGAVLPDDFVFEGQLFSDAKNICNAEDQSVRPARDQDIVVKVCGSVGLRGSVRGFGCALFCNGAMFT